VLELARRFLRSKKPDAQEALWGLRLLYGGAFLVQIGFALALGLLLALIATPRENGGDALARILQVLAVANLFLGLVLALLTAWRGGKDRALSAALILGGMLATPAWFILLLVMARSDPVYPLRLGLLLLLYFPLGFFVAGLLTPLALKAEKKPR
jgi:hypothetical protein